VKVCGIVPSGCLPICPATVTIFVLPRENTQTSSYDGFGGATSGGLNVSGRDLKDMMFEVQLDGFRSVNRGVRLLCLKGINVMLEVSFLRGLASY
jgi:hypothetical protein